MARAPQVAENIQRLAHLSNSAGIEPFGPEAAADQSHQKDHNAALEEWRTQNAG